MAEEAEDPQRVRRPPVGLVAVEDDGRLATDPLGAHEPREPLGVDVVAGDGIVQLGVPVDLDRAGDVAGLVEEDVLVGFDHHQAWVVQVLRQPVGRDQLLGMGVLGELGIGVEGDGHGPMLGQSVPAVAGRP